MNKTPLINLNFKRINNNFYRPWQNRNASKKYRLNEQIRVLEVRVIDAEGQQLGVLPTRQAIDLASEQGLDLIEVSPLAQPPVCKIMDYGKFQYQQSRSQQKAKKIDTKVIRLSLNIGQHDIAVRQKQANKFLSQGHNVRLELKLRGREKAFKAKAIEVIQQFLAGLGDIYKTDKNIEQQGSIISTTISKK